MSLLTVEGIFLAVSRVILRTMDECKCFRCLERVILWSRWGLAKDEFRYRIYRIQIQIQDLVSSNILLMQNWAGLKLNSSIFWGEKNKSFGNKSCKIYYTIFFVFHFPAIWSITSSKHWNLIGCFVFSVASSLAGKKMRFKANWTHICVHSGFLLERNFVFFLCESWQQHLLCSVKTLFWGGGS